MISRNGKELLCHTVVFAAVHLVLYYALQIDAAWPEELEQWRQWMLEGKTGYYHTESGIYVITIWAVLYAVDTGIYLLKRPSGMRDSKDGHTVSAMDSTAAPAIDQPQEPPVTDTGSGWRYLILGGLLEIVWAGLLKVDLLGGPLLLIFVLSFHLLMKAAKTLPAGTVYAVFTGIGAAGTFALDIALFGEPVEPVRIGLAVLLIGFIMILKYASTSTAGRAY